VRVRKFTQEDGRHPQAGSQYVIVPLSNSSNSIRTSEARILDISAARESIAGKLTHYKKHAPYYSSVVSIVHEAFDKTTDQSLVQLNVRSLQAVCQYLGIHFDSKACSDLNLSLPTSLGPGDWAPYICSLVGATSYVNPIGGQELFDPSEFSRRGIKLYFAKTREFSYHPSPYTYEPNLSILDVLMWNSPTAVGAMLFANALSSCKLEACSQVVCNPAIHCSSNIHVT
jgi:hypothetical protein